VRRRLACTDDAIVGVSTLRNKAKIRFSFGGAPVRVSVSLDEIGALEPDSQSEVPVLVLTGSSLVGLITAGAEVVIARM
jgi:hypothetical protein